MEDVHSIRVPLIGSGKMNKISTESFGHTDYFQEVKKFIIVCCPA